MLFRACWIGLYSTSLGRLLFWRLYIVGGGLADPPFEKAAERYRALVRKLEAAARKGV
jgi:hypothetical protein